MKRSPRKMNFYHNRHRSDGKLIEKEERITTSDLENNYTNTEKNLSNNIIQIPKENNEEKYFEDSNKLIDSMEKLLNSFQIKLKIPQKNIITLSSNTFNNDIYKENIELRKEQKTLKERLKYLLKPKINFEEEFSQTTTESNINEYYEDNYYNYEDYESDDSKIRENIFFNKNRKIKNK